MRVSWPAVVLLLLAVAHPALSQTGAPEIPVASVPCTLPPDLTTPTVVLSRLAAALAGSTPIQILALGSGSTVGNTTGNAGPAFVYNRPTAAFPHRMIEALQTAQPAARFELTVAGGRNMTAEEMLPLLRQELATRHYDLVVWQTATVEAVRGMRPDSLRAVLQSGAEDAAKAGADVVIVDPQFSRFLRANTDLAPYELALRQAAAVTNAALFERFALTREWASDGQIDLERVSPAAREQTISELNICIGRALARFVLAGVDRR